MKRTIAAALLVLGLLAPRAQAWDLYLRAAAADPIVTSSKVYTPSIAMTTLVIDGGGAGGIAVLHTTMPRTATSPIIIPRLTRVPSAAVPSGTSCDRICAVVAQAGTSIANANTNTCNSTIQANDQLAGTAQWTVLTTDFLGLVPSTVTAAGQHNCGAVGGPTECNGGELYLFIMRGGGCAQPGFGELNYTQLNISGT